MDISFLIPPGLYDRAVDLGLVKKGDPRYARHEMPRAKVEQKQTQPPGWYQRFNQRMK